ncbi:MAG: cupin domain-containing protein [Gammaproteobacteria bacterium]|uniref:cupin domain-containing protein n=1 Tax=Rhodoferax sp. TaxID=50421 RepID=UPI00178E827E|nr:cupin domain-containing protein [Rhodoferax sp.]MBU3897585.1 cupin domain-containing protein [Gammaproteobacteria bacterium]MBA3059404.1 cupin domain-containing protein [Rhodoferax sp.]MBU3997470.1 cupin domain-containing protein [Gammaproteobacteria bacterium]MBU4017771.1 cupin domain-containing protein [Gammaproteobacteria bacterium]MBU4081214.1 cupin domain-containing protein [Gammaproteobacteria bacterium]
MDISKPLPLLGGLNPQLFMKKHWQKKPLLIRQAIPNFKPLLDRVELFELASREDTQSRLVLQQPGQTPGWQLKSGPFARRGLPPLKQPGWTVLVQGVDLQHEAVHALMNQFRFVPDARLDDVMISYASDGGGVGPHFDSYDVFLLQAQGRRRWRIGRQKDRSLQPDVPLKILAHFEPEEEFVLEPGDMLYLPLLYAHDGVALGECMTYSIGFRSPSRAELARELLERLAEDAEDAVGVSVYRDPTQAAVSQPAEIPAQMVDFARDALQHALKDPAALGRALGEYMTEPKANVWFDAAAPVTHPAAQALAGQGGQIQLDRRTKMMFDAKHIFINGEIFRAGGRDATLMRRLADQRYLAPADVARLSSEARCLLQDWQQAGWLHQL